MSYALDTSAEDSVTALAMEFYRTARAGALRLSDGGGPFGFDITTALQVDYLIKAYGCDGFVETGCFLGDTTDYVSRTYPSLTVKSCEIEQEYAQFAAVRLSGRANATVITGDSASVLPNMLEGLQRPFVYLDAHWYEHWPLADELSHVERGIVCIDDFNLRHPRFGFDTYAGVDCGPELVAQARPALERIYVGNPYADYQMPCLQVGRRSGTGFFPIGLAETALAASEMFVPITLHPSPGYPDWEEIERSVM